MTTGPSRQNSISHKIVKNTAYNIFGRFWGILVTLFLIPYIISRIGIERFGVWAIVGVVTGYFGLLDFGIGTSFVKYIAEFYTKKEFEKISRLINTGFTLYFIYAISGVLLILILKSPILALLNIPQYLRHEAGVILLIGIALFGASNAMSPFLSVQGGLQRMDISNNIGIGLSVINIAGTIFFLERGFGLIGLMINNVIVFTAMTVANVITARALIPELRFKIFHLDREIFKKLFHFGYNMQIAKISGMVASQIDKILISCFLSIGLVTFYQLGSSVVYNACSFAYVFTSALMPAFSEIDARGERTRLIEAYLRSIKYLSFFVVPTFIFLAISAPQIMFIWMGYGYAQSSAVIQILAAALLVYTIAQVPASVCAAIGKPQLLAVGSVIIIVTNVILSAFFIKMFGFLGAAWGTLIAVNTGTVYFLIQLHKNLKTPIAPAINKTLPFFLSCAGSAAAVSVIWASVDRHSLFLNCGRIPSLLLFFSKGLIFVLGYLICVHYLEPFDPDEIEIIKKKVPFFGPVIVRIISRSRFKKSK